MRLWSGLLNLICLPLYIAGIVPYPTKFTFPYPVWLMIRHVAKTFMGPPVGQKTFQRYSFTFLERIVYGNSFNVFGHVFLLSGVLLNFRRTETCTCQITSETLQTWFLRQRKYMLTTKVKQLYPYNLVYTEKKKQQQ